MEPATQKPSEEERKGSCCSEGGCSCRGANAPDEQLAKITISPEEAMRRVVEKRHQEEKDALGQYGDFVDKRESALDYVETLIRGKKAEWLVYVASDCFTEEKPFLIILYKSGLIFNRGKVPDEVRSALQDLMAPYDVRFIKSGSIR